MKTVLKVIGVIIVVLIIVAIAAPFLINVNRFRPDIESRLSTALGRDVKVGNLTLSILSGSVGADQLSIADDPKFSQSPFITAKSLKVGVELRPLIFDKQLNITHIVIDQPVVALLRDQGGKWNFSSLGTQEGRAQQTASGSEPNKPAAQSKPAQQTQTENKPAEKSSGAPGNLSVAKLDLNGGRISVGSIPAKRKPVVYDSVNISVRDFSFTNSFPVTLSANLPAGGTLKIDGNAGPINSSDAALTPINAKVNVSKLDLAQSAVVDPSLGLAGTADFDGMLQSDGHTAKTNGTLRTVGLKVSPKGSPSGRPVDVKYSLEHDLQNQSGRISQADIAIGKALAKLAGTYDMKGGTTSIRTKLNGQSMSVDDLQAVLPAVGVILPPGSQLRGGTLSVDLDSAGPVDRLVTTGTVRLSNSQLAGFNLGSKLQAISALSGKQTGNDTSIQNLSANVRIAPEGTQLSNLNLLVPAIGTLVGAGTIAQNSALNFSMAANLSGGAVTGLTELAGLGGKGTGNIPFLIQGSTSDPKFMPDVKGIVNSQLKGLLQGQANQQNQNQNQNPLQGLMGIFGKKKQPPK